MKKVLRGQIYYAELDPVIGSEQGGLRPVVILQCNKGTKNCPTCIIAPLTKLVNKKFKMKSHVLIRPKNYLTHYSVVLVEHTRAISKDRLKQLISKVTSNEQRYINKAIVNTFGLDEEESGINEKEDL